MLDKHLYRIFWGKGHLEVEDGLVVERHGLEALHQVLEGVRRGVLRAGHKGQTFAQVSEAGDVLVVPVLTLNATLVRVAAGSETRRTSMAFVSRSPVYSRWSWGLFGIRPASSRGKNRSPDASVARKYPSRIPLGRVPLFRLVWPFGMHATGDWGGAS